ncbi:MAG: DDE-type integrase/transposase/recombinase [Acidobacteria bacterium]|nr:DDE-type integrase/transposase/recombinase [Acidobacteriota bacterium]
MLSDQERQSLYQELSIPHQGCQLVERARVNAPVRKVKSSGRNVVTHYASRKMNRLVSLESRHVEFPAAILYEHDNSILEFYPQPVALDLWLDSDESTDKYRLQHTVDFLAITKDRIFLDEWRQDERLKRIMKEQPGRYRFDGTHWSYPALEAELAKKGITYRLRAASELPGHRAENLRFLSDYLNVQTPQVGELPLAALTRLLAETPVWDLIDLINAGVADHGSFTSDDIYKAIAEGHLYFDFEGDLLGDTDRAVVYRDKAAFAFHQSLGGSPTELVERLDATLEIGAKVHYEGNSFEVALMGKDHVVLMGGGKTTELSLDVVLKLHDEGRLTILNAHPTSPSRPHPVEYPGPQQMEKIVQRLDWLETAKIAPDAVPISIRTLQRMRRRMRLADDSILDRHLALADGYARCGNRNRKLPEEILALVHHVIDRLYNKQNGPNKAAAYHLLKSAMVGIQSPGLDEGTLALASAIPSGTRPPSKKTFLREIAKRESVLAREGSRSAYQKAPIVDYLEREVPIHGYRPFEQVHIDHTPLEILARSPEERDSIGGVWLTLAIDAATRKVLGFYLAFEAPSYKSTMMVLRDLVLRHHRMPDLLVLDNGADFTSHQLRRLCRVCGCSIRHRPKGRARHGSVLERFFGTLHTQMIHRLDGNTQAYKRHRLMTPAVNPNRFVSWTLVALHGLMEHFFEKLYGTENHPALGESPNEHFERRMVETGARLMKRMEYNRSFLVETCPEADGGPTRVVDNLRGVKVNHHWYWDDALSARDLSGKEVQVRVDPWDPRVVYVLIGQFWVECRSKLHALMKNYTEIELRYAVEQLRKRHGVKKKDMTPERLAEWMRAYDVASFDPRLAKQQSEMKYLYRSLGLTEINDPLNPHPKAVPALGYESTAQSDMLHSKPEEAGRHNAGGLAKPFAPTLPPGKRIQPVDQIVEESYDLL